ncbi:MAG: ASPIC/UnbV domain-containing protein, partial [Planctomycetota bacterium]
GTLFFDVDNNGFLDLYVASYSPNHLFMNTGVAPLVDRAEEYGVAESGSGFTQTFCCTAGDIDDDGDLDLVVQTKFESIALFINHEGENRKWLKVELRDASPNVYAVGAMVEVRHNSRTHLQPVLAGTALKSSIPFVLHFGLGLNPEAAERLVITWPDGEISVLTDILIQQHYLVDRSVVGSFRDCNGNLIDDEIDIKSRNSEDTNSNGIPDECEPRFQRGDANGDSMFDVSDVVVILLKLFAFGEMSCLDSGDGNDDGALDIADALFLLNFLFTFGAEPPAPHLECGLDPTADPQGDLGCASPTCP